MKRSKQAVLLTGLFCVVFGAKILTISRYGNDVPYWDQWDADPDLYLAYFDGNLSLDLLFSPHNEHRIFFTRVLSLAGLLAAGEWSPILQMIVNAALHSIVIVLLTWGFIRTLPDEDSLPLVVLSAIIFSLPIAHGNALVGFQSVFYFLLLFSTICLLLIVRSEPLSLGWAFGLLTAIASYFSLASGTFTFFAAATVLSLQAVNRRTVGWRELLSIAVFLIGGIVCLMFIPHHDSLKALPEFMKALLWLAGFPFSTAIGFNGPLIIRTLLAIVALAPALALVAVICRRPTNNGGAWFTIAIFAFVWIQIDAISYGRTVGYYAPRYLDILLLALPASFVALSLTGANWLLRTSWTLAALACLVFSWANTSIAGLAHQKQSGDQQLQNVRAFVATGDSFEGKPPLEIPYPNTKRLAELLSIPTLRAMLPAEFRPNDQATQELRATIFPHTRIYKITAWLKSIILSSGGLVLAVGLALLFACLVERNHLLLRGLYLRFRFRDPGA